MRQHITIEQLKELSIEAGEKLDNWLYKKQYFGYHLSDWGDPVGDKEPPLLSIGQMIEFLEKDWADRLVGPMFPCEPCCMVSDVMYGVIDPEKICDALWSAVKEKLEN